MKIRYIAILTLLAMFTLTGCESKQAKVTRLEKVANDLEQQYRTDCYDPNTSADGTAIDNALRGKTPDARDKAIADKRQQEVQARVASPHCQDLKARKTAAGQDWAAALNAASGSK